MSDCPKFVRGILTPAAASCVVALADPNDLAAARRMLRNTQGIASEQFVLVDLPDVLLPGFSWCLERLQKISQSDDHLAFSSLIAPDPPSREGLNNPPKYSDEEGKQSANHQFLFS